MAAPSEYSEELSDRICDLISSSNKGLATICEENSFPSPTTIFRWIDKYPEFRDKYMRAREAQADYLADEMLTIADDNAADDTPFTGANHIQRAKLQIETRKWIASKLKPKKYGDKIDLTTLGEKLEPTIIQWGNREISV